MAAVAYSVEGSTAVLTVRNAPVNALSQAVREGLLVGIRRAAADGQVRGVIIAGSGQTFPAGADIREFGSAAAAQSPNLVEVCTAIEECPKPVAAAIHGTALGGGLEVALSCHYRVGAAGAKVGLPEVALGILPGAGGTQRLPRLVGCETAIKMMTSGMPINAKKALAAGVVDEVAPADGKTPAADSVVEAAVAFAEALGGAPADPARVLSSLPVPPVAEGFFEGAKGATKKAARGMVAPLSIVDAVAAAATAPSFAEGLAEEARLFMGLARGPQAPPLTAQTLHHVGRLFVSQRCIADRMPLQAAALQHVFFAERQIGKVKGELGGGTPAKVASAAIVGARPTLKPPAKPPAHTQ